MNSKVREQTPCEKLGYKVGEQFLKCEDNSGFSSGSIIELINDDGSECPEFKLVSGICEYADNRAFEVLEHLQKISTEKEKTKEPEVVKEDNEVNAPDLTGLFIRAMARPFGTPLEGYILPEQKVETLESGVKYDGGKLRYSLLPKGTLDEVVKVLEFGANKYAADNWQKVPEARTRYYDAMNRHVQAWWNGETTDPETGCNHLAHAVCCSMFLMWFDKAQQVN